MNQETIDIESEFVLLKEDIRRISTCFLGSALFADDILQDVFLTLLKKKHRFKGKSSVKTYILAIARNISYKYIKRMAKQKELSQQHTENSYQESDNFDKERLNIALRKIKAKHRDPLLLREIEQYSYGEIAEIMGIREGTVKFRINYAKKKLLKILNKECVA